MEKKKQDIEKAVPKGQLTLKAFFSKQKTKPESDVSKQNPDVNIVHELITDTNDSKYKQSSDEIQYKENEFFVYSINDFTLQNKISEDLNEYFDPLENNNSESSKHIPKHADKMDDDSSSNAFSYMMATRHKQDKGIQYLMEKEKELAEAEELFPLIMKNIPKERIFKWLKKNITEQCQSESPESNSDSSTSLPNVTEGCFSDNSSSAKFPSPEGLKSSMQSGKKKDRKTVKFCKFVMRHLIKKQKGEEDWEWILDDELNKEKEKYWKEQIDKLINVKEEDYESFEELFKDEINECIEGTPKLNKMEKQKPLRSSRNKKNEAKSINNDDKENKKNIQPQILSFLTAPIEKINNVMSDDVIEDAEQSAGKTKKDLKVNKENKSIEDDSKKRNNVKENNSLNESKDSVPSNIENNLLQIKNGTHKNILDNKLNDNHQSEDTNRLRRSNRNAKKTSFFDISIKNQIPSSKKRKISDVKHSPVMRKKKEKKTASVEEIHVSDNDNSIEVIEASTNDDVKPKKKLASIFLSKEDKLTETDPKNEKPMLSSVEIKARHDFLFSDEPVIISSVVIEEEEILEWPPFPIPSHVRQASGEFFNLSEPQDQILISIDNVNKIEKSDCLRDLLNLENKQKFEISYPAISELEMYHILSHLRDKNKSFPVLGTFKNYLDSKKDFIDFYEKESDSNCDIIDITSPPNRKRKRTSKKLSLSKKRKTSSFDEKSVKQEPLWQKWIPYSWTQVFAPKCSQYFMGNEAEVLSIRTWLEEWTNISDSQECKLKRFYSASNSEFSDDDDDNHLVNTVLLSGPTGIGKSCLVYSLAQELGFKVIEINASSRRQGKSIIAQLSEATQSHTVSSNSPCPNSPSQSQEFSKSKPISKSLKYSKPEELKDSLSQTSESEKKKKMALILFEDIDIVFDEFDDGFISAVMNFMATTKRPIILTCNRLYPTFLDRIKEGYIEHKLHPPSKEIVANHLQLMCLANGIFANGKEIEHLVNSNNGDIRKTILELQMWSLSGSTSVQWLKMDGKLRKSTSSDKLLESDPILDIVPRAQFKKSADIPISNGAIWTKFILPLINMEARINLNLFNLDWHMIECNLLSLLLFNLTVVKRKRIYPLTQKSPYIEINIKKQRKDWLSYETDDEDSPPAPSPVKKIPNSVQSSADVCISSLSKMYKTLADLDLLNKQSNSKKWHNYDYVTSLEDDLPDIVPDSIDLDNVNTISNTIAKNCLFKVNKDIANSIEGVSDVDGHLSAPMCDIDNESVYNSEKLYISDKMNKLNVTMKSKVATVCQPNTRGLILDYLPYIREFARSDEMGYSMKKYKRNKRFLSHLKFAGFYFNPDDCIDMANVFPL